MTKNIVICCDGTSNQPAHDMTNVVKLYFTLANDPSRQVTFYHPGLGTMEPPGALTPFEKFWTRKLGLAMGRGVEDDIRDAYVFLADKYCPGDDVFIFGFSRGAYTARALTGLLTMYGLIEPDNAPLAPYAIRMLFAINRARNRSDTVAGDRIFALAQLFKRTYSRPCKPKFVGLWDTVNSVGWFAHPTRLPYTANNPDIAIARHAIAIDERRAFFPPNLWRPSSKPPSGPIDLKQVWFPGSHSDVGGGYPEGRESAQSKYALDWMITEAEQAGLIVDHARADEILGRTPGSQFVAASVSEPVHETLTGWWLLTEFLPKPHYDYQTGKKGWRANLFRRRYIPDGSLVHQSAFLRGPNYLKRLPAKIARIPLTGTGGDTS
jgi:uncharacterized protein (DUF2235 family)